MRKYIFLIYTHVYISFFNVINLKRIGKDMGGVGGGKLGNAINIVLTY